MQQPDQLNHLISRGRSFTACPRMLSMAQIVFAGLETAQHTQHLHQFTDQIDVRPLEKTLLDSIVPGYFQPGSRRRGEQILSLSLQETGLCKSHNRQLSNHIIVN